ncbi:MAG: hypothetical protein KKA32_16320 [Actinobacteria bacterium]|nr:hypothetical protein [Actinomycetota bacterium]
MAKKEARRAARQAELAKAKTRGPKQPTVRRAVIQGAILSAIYLVIVQIFMKDESRPLWVDVMWTGVFWVFYSVFIYYWETFLFNRRKRKQQAGGKK